MIRKFTRRSLIIAAAALACSGASPTWAQSYPAKPVRIIMPYQAGGSSDAMGRFFANALGKELGQSFVVENRVGAGGNIGTALAAKAPADGYTLLLGTAATHALNPSMYSSVGYDPEKDFEPIGMLGRVTMAIAAPPGTGVTNIQELIAKSRSAKLDVAIPNTMSNLVQELITRRGGGAMTSVPYKGSAAAMTDALGGHVNVVIDTAAALQPHVASGKFVALGVTSLTPSQVLPGVKPVAEQGLPGFEVTGWFAFFAPKGTSHDVITRLNGALKRVSAQPETHKALLGAGFDTSPVGEPAQIAIFIRDERVKWDRIIKAANIKAD